MKFSRTIGRDRQWLGRDSMEFEVAHCETTMPVFIGRGAVWCI